MSKNDALSSDYTDLFQTKLTLDNQYFDDFANDDDEEEEAEAYPVFSTSAKSNPKSKHVRSDSDTILDVDDNYSLIDNFVSHEEIPVDIMEESYKLAEEQVQNQNYEKALRLFQNILKRTSKEIKYHRSSKGEKSHQKLIVYASSLYNIGLLFYKFQLYSDAVPYFQKCAKFSREYLGEYHPFVSSSLVKSGLSLLQQNTSHSLETGILTLREAARLSKITRGKDSDKTAKCCVYLGYGYALYGMLLQSSNQNETDSVGTPQAQISLRSNASVSVNGGSPSKKALHSRTQSTGSQFSSSNLSNTLGLTQNSKAQKCIEKASKYYAESLGIYRGILRRANDSNPQTLRSTRLAIATTLEFIVELQVHLKKWSKAIGSLSEVLEIQSFVLGDSHPSTHRTSKRIEDLNSKINKMEESVAEAFLVHDFVNATSNALSSNNSNVSLLNDPPQNPKTVLEWMQKAHYLVYADMQQAKWIECRQCLEIAANMLKEQKQYNDRDDDNSDLILQAKLLNNLGVAYMFQSDDPSRYASTHALPCLQNALNICTTESSSDGITSGELLLKSGVLMNLSHVLLVTDPSEYSSQALEHLNLAMGIKRHIFGALHPTVMSCLDHLATTQTQLRQLLDAMNSFKLLLKSQVEFYGENHICVATTNGKLANLYIQSRDYESAIQCLLKVQRYQKIQVMAAQNNANNDGEIPQENSNDVKMLEATNMAIEKIRGLCEQNRVWI